jgi:hypothetical protein
MPHPAILRRAALAALILLVTATGAAAQRYEAQASRRYFVSVGVDWLYTYPQDFEQYPLEALLGREVGTAWGLEPYHYFTRDGAITVDVLEFRRRNRGAGITVFPFGSRQGATLALRGAIEQLPTVRLAFAGAEAPGDYALTRARAYDVAAVVHVADRNTGWGLGTYAFLGGGGGRIRSDIGDGDRYFGEAGGGVNFGLLGAELSVKMAMNRMAQPVEHRFWTVPVTLRGTLNF